METKLAKHNFDDNNCSNRGQTARDDRATKAFSSLQQEVLRLKKIVDEHDREISTRKNRNPQLGGIIELTDDLMRRFREALTRREELDDDWKSNFLYDIEGKLITMGENP